MLIGLALPTSILPIPSRIISPMSVPPANAAAMLLLNEMPSNEGDATFYIKENISLLKDLNGKEITKSNNKLLKLLNNRPINKENSEFYKHIDILTYTKKSASTLDTLQQSLNYIKDKMIKEEITLEENEYENE